MYKSGNYFIDVFSLILVFLPLVPVAVILRKGLYRRDTLNFLMILCLLQFIQRLSQWREAIPHAAVPAMVNVFLLLECGIYFMIFRNQFGGKPKEILYFLSVVFFSSIITHYLDSGLDQQKLFLRMAQYGFIAIIITYSLAELMKQDNLRIFQLPIFWIGIGTVFYFLILSLTELTDRLSNYAGQPPAKVKGIEKLIILHVADLARYFFYTMAVGVRGFSRSSDP
jgi:uncharacterized membrane protein YqaE (UPF0057 family)